MLAEALDETADGVGKMREAVCRETARFWREKQQGSLIKDPVKKP